MGRDEKMKKQFAVSMVGLTLLGMSIGTKNVQAENTTATVANSKSTVTLKAPTEPSGPNPPIVDPTDPTDPTGQKGILTLDAVSSFDFGTIALDGKAVPTSSIVKKNDKDVPYKQGLQVTDKRGTGAGWKVTVGLSDFKGENNHLLKGATVEFPVGKLHTNNGNDDHSPTSSAITLQVNGGAQTILTANKDTGMGSWYDEFEDPTTVKLNVPGGQYADNYTANLNWTLTDTPA